MNKEIQKIKPSGIFTNYIYKAIPLAFDESMSYYETLCGILSLLKTQEEVVNNNADLLAELESYVQNYFKNLDVQTEINNKLDAMAQSGQLTEIIAQYLNLNGVLAFNTLNDLVNAENITNGSITKTLGKLNYNDGKGHYYKIRTITSSDVVDNDNIVALNISNTLIAEKIDDFEINVLKEKTNYITPEMFGAKGDGVTDDTQAFKDMINYINSIVPTKEFTSEVNCKDFTKINLVFSKQYLVNSPITFNNTYGLILDNLRLICGNNFEGDYLLGLTGVTRQSSINNLYLNGNLKANKCLYIKDYTLGIRINNAEITRFYNYGIYMESKGHETIITNTKINQIEYGELNELSTLIPEGNGIGLYLDSQRYDNHFTNLIINYCRTKLMEINGGSNMFESSHFYGSRIDIVGSHNTMQNCSFDTTKVYWSPFNKIFNSMFFGISDTDSFIYLTGASDIKYQYNFNMLIGNTFIGESNNNNPINYGNFTGVIQIECISNSFDKVTPFSLQSSAGYIPEKWKKNKYTGSNTTSGSVRIGDFLIQYGTISASGQVNFPVAYEYNVQSVIMQKQGASNYTPFPNDITNSGFYANSVDVNTQWIAFGRMWEE